MDIRHEQFQNGGAFAIEDGEERLGELTYHRVGDVIYVDHTEVDERLRGQGMARRLVDSVIAFARESGEKIVPLCSYTRAQFKKDASLHDVLKAYPPGKG